MSISLCLGFALIQLPELGVYVFKHFTKIYSSKNVIETTLVSVAKSDGETNSVRSILETDRCTCSEVLKTTMELSDNLNRRMDLIESKFGR